jgi:imidazolonepropionase-like amidohydrolase
LREELEAAFAICHQREFKVMAHATNPDAVKAAVSLGTHSVEHGYMMDEECIQMLGEREVWYVPTLAITHLTPEQATSGTEKRWVEEKQLAPDLIRRADAASEEHRSWFQAALHAGLRMALGSDIRPLQESALLEMGLWVKDGATTWQTLLAATRDAAALCGREKDLGTVDVGKFADLIAVAGNPLEDIDNLRSLMLVIKEGRVVSDKRGR